MHFRCTTLLRGPQHAVPRPNYTHKEHKITGLGLDVMLTSLLIWVLHPQSAYRMDLHPRDGARTTDRTERTNVQVDWPTGQRRFVDRQISVL